MSGWNEHQADYMGGPYAGVHVYTAAQGSIYMGGPWRECMCTQLYVL